MKSIKLNLGDAAIVLRADGQRELIVEPGNKLAMAILLMAWAAEQPDLKERFASELDK